MKNGKKLLATGVLLSLNALNAYADLTLTANGLGVYDSGLNATWTQDANLLGTMESNPAAYGYADSSSLITAIINANGGVIHDTPNGWDNGGIGTYDLSTNDFGGGNGTVDWWAGQAYVHYLDSINYGGSNQWALPTSNEVVGFDSGSQLGELFYNELGLVAGSYSIPLGLGPFSNLQGGAFWSGSEYTGGQSAWTFWIAGGAYNGYQTYSDKMRVEYYVWAVSPGDVVAPVPVPSAIWLFGSALAGFISFNRRKTNQQ